MDEKVIAGVDIGSTSVRVVLGKQAARDPQEIEVLGAGQVPLTEGVIKGAISNINKTVDAVRRAMDEAVQHAGGIRPDVVNASVAGRQLRCWSKHGSITRSPEEGNEVKVSDVQRLFRDISLAPVQSGSTIVHVLPQEYTVEGGFVGECYDAVGSTGSVVSADFQLISVPSPILENLRASLDKALGQVRPRPQINIMLSSLAATMSVLDEVEKDAGVALVDIGGATTDLVIIHKRIIRHVATFPFGGNSITQDIERGCRVLYRQAETLKVKFGQALHEEVRLNELITVPNITPPGSTKDVSAKNLAIVTETRLKEIAVMVAAEIARVGYEDKITAGVVLTGGSVHIHNTEELFRRVLDRQEVRIGYPTLSVARNAEHIGDPSFATAVGLVLRGIRSLDPREDDYERKLVVEEEHRAQPRQASAPASNGHLAEETPAYVPPAPTLRNPFSGLGSRFRSNRAVTPPPPPPVPEPAAEEAASAKPAREGNGFFSRFFNGLLFDDLGEDDRFKS
jgi:cell division protein FtsA